MKSTRSGSHSAIIVLFLLFIFACFIWPEATRFVSRELKPSVEITEIGATLGPGASGRLQLEAWTILFANRIHSDYDLRS